LSDPTNDAGEPAEKRVRKTRVAKTAAPKDSLTIPPLEAASAAPPAAPAATPAVAPPPAPPRPPRAAARQQAPAPATASHATHETPAPSATATGSTDGSDAAISSACRPQAAGHRRPARIQRGRRPRAQAGRHLRDPEGADPPRRRRRRRRRAGNPAGRLRLPARGTRRSYLAGPDDTYISPSQIRRFNLRTGDYISGKHPLAEGRRALLRAAQGRRPSTASRRKRRRTRSCSRT
jgi:hypothetical protein